MATTQSKYGRKFDEEFKREAATLASAPGRSDETVGFVWVWVGHHSVYDQILRSPPR